MGKNWIEPLRSWILDIQKAKKLSQGDNFEDIKAFVQKVGTNHQLLDKSASFSFSAPWDFLAQFLARRASRRGEHSDLSPAKKLKSFEMWRWRESNPRAMRGACMLLRSLDCFNYLPVVFGAARQEQTKSHSILDCLFRYRSQSFYGTDL